MTTSNRFAKAGAVCYVLWGLVHVAGAAYQLSTLRQGGGAGLAAVIATARPGEAPGEVPPAAAAFMGMGALNILWIGALVAILGATLNWRNARLGYWLNLGIVGATDAALVVALLAPGVMAWSDGSVGLVLFAFAVACSTMGRRRAGAPALRAQPA